MSVMAETSQSATGPYVAIAQVGFALKARTAAFREAVLVKVPGGDADGGDGGGEGGEGGEGGKSGESGEGVHEMRRLSETVSASSRKSVVPQ
eukprot:scaffold48138_cov63-Phaeocystis_antarctica.AAC.2